MEWIGCKCSDVIMSSLKFVHSVLGFFLLVKFLDVGRKCLCFFEYRSYLRYNSTDKERSTDAPQHYLCLHVASELIALPVVPMPDLCSDV